MIGINTTGNKVKIGPGLAGTKMPSGELGLDRELLRLPGQRSVLEGGTRGRKASWELGASGPGTSGWEEKGSNSGNIKKGACARFGTGSDGNQRGREESA